MTNMDATTERATSRGATTKRSRTSRRIAETVTTSFGNDLRSLILGMAVADPQMLADSILQALKGHARVSKLIKEALTDKSPQASSPRMASAAQMAWLRKQRHAKSWALTVAYKKPFTYQGKLIDPSVTKGQEAIILGGCAVSPWAIASLLPEKGRDKALEEIASLLAQTYGGAVTRRALTVRSTTVSSVVYNGKVARTGVSTKPDPQDTPYQVILAIQGSWDNAEGLARHSGEMPLAFATRLLNAVRKSADFDAEAKQALEIVYQDFPETIAWK